MTDDLTPPHWGAEATPSTPGDVGELIERAFASVENQMDNFLPAKGESWQDCYTRRLKDELAAALQSQADAAGKLVALLREAHEIFWNMPGKPRSFLAKLSEAIAEYEGTRHDG